MLNPVVEIHWNALVLLQESLMYTPYLLDELLFVGEATDGDTVGQHLIHGLLHGLGPDLIICRDELAHHLAHASPVSRFQLVKPKLVDDQDMLVSKVFGPGEMVTSGLIIPIHHKDPGVVLSPVYHPGLKGLE